MNVQTEGWEQRMEAEIQLPAIPTTEVCVTSFGVRADTREPQTESLQAAIDHAAALGGGRVIVPSGRFLTGALRLRSRVELHLAMPDSVLAFSRQTDERHYPLVLCHWEGTPCLNYSPLLYALDEEDIAITGNGLLDGQADVNTWWNWHHQVENAWSRDGANPQEKARMALRAMNEEGVPVECRRFGDGSFLRPAFIQLMRCRRVLLSGFTLKRSPMWQVNPVQCSSVTITGLTLRSHGPNNDGVDPESCNGVLIQHCTFDTGDDCISLKSGRDRDGREAAMPCRNVLIRHNVFADGHGGVALGSEAAGGICDVIVHHNQFNSPNLTYALRMKTNARRGGVMENIWFHDCQIQRVSGAAIHGTMLYEDGRNGDYLPRMRNIRIERITAAGGDYGIFLEAFQETPITGLELRDIQINGVENELWAVHWQNAIIHDVTINGRRYPCPTQVRVEGVPLAGSEVNAVVRGCGEPMLCHCRWMLNGMAVGEGNRFVLPEHSGGGSLQLVATAPNGESVASRPYTVLAAPANPDVGPGECGSEEALRLLCRGLWDGTPYDGSRAITRGELARLLKPLTSSAEAALPEDVSAADAPFVRAALGSQLLALRENGRFESDGLITRREMGTVAMLGSGLSYRNASTTMPQCADSVDVGAAYGTNVARALYYGFQTLDSKGWYHPLRAVSWAEAVVTLNRVADFAGL